MQNAGTSSVPLYYRHSGQFSIPGAMIGLVAGVMAAVLLALVYTYADIYIPIIYATILLCMGFGAAIGFITAKILAILKNRNSVLLIGTAILSGLAAMYASWSFWICHHITASSDDGISISAFDLALKPALLWRLIQLINEHGTWSIGHASSSGDAVSGIFLWLCWLGEAGLFFTFVYIGSKTVSDIPFCERCANWCKKNPSYVSMRLSDPPNANADAKQLATYDFSLLSQRGQRLDEDLRWITLQVYQCPTCGQTATLTLQHSTLVIEKGKTQTKHTMLLNKLLLNAQQIQQLQQANMPAPAAPATMAPTTT